MGYREALSRLYALQPSGIQYDLDRMLAAAAARGYPQRGLPVIHIAGTNGKGSVAAMIVACARAEGIRTGLYTSPHLHSFRERISLDGKPIGREEVAERAESILEMLNRKGAPQLTFFEATTLLAFEAFRDATCELIVLETGLGGRLDATNIVERPLACAITSIGIDHVAYLGETIVDIAREKAGIAKSTCPLVLGRLDPVALEEIETIAEKVGAPTSVLGRDFESYEGRLSLEGDYQRDNAAVAIAALRAGVRVSDTSIETGLAKTVWPGRMERIDAASVHTSRIEVGAVEAGHTDGGPSFLLESAHNLEGARALARYLAQRPKPPTLVFGSMRDKDWRAMLAELVPHVKEVITVSAELPRAEDAALLAAECRGLVADSVVRGIQIAQQRCTQDDLVVVAGSIFVVAEARAYLLDIDSEMPIAL